MLDGLRCWWDPLTNKCQAFSLMAELRIDVTHSASNKTVSAFSMNAPSVCVEQEGEDKSASTLRAVVRAAAEIVRAMQNNDNRSE